VQVNFLHSIWQLFYKLPFFIYLIVYSISSYTDTIFNNNDVISKASNNDTWQTLLHLKDQELTINDRNFILSIDDFNPKKELIKNIDFFSDNKEQICHFPARYFFLSSQFEHLDPFDISHCDGLKRFMDLVPFSKVELIYASEVVTSPPSMMGHAFLRVSGINANGNPVSHSISFLAELNTQNPIKLAKDGLFSGMDGFYSVKPFRLESKKYLEVENRNLWIFELELTEEQKKLIQLHIWELKDKNIRYLFQNYNCSTSLLYTLSVAVPELREYEKLFVSPLDIVKASLDLGIVKHQVVELSRDWKLAMLASIIDSEIISNIEDYASDKNGRYSSLNDADKHLVSNYLLETEKELQPVQQALFESDATTHFQIDLTNYKNPSKTPQDSAANFRLGSINSSPYLSFSLLPASHRLNRDNREYFSESELVIGEVEIKVSPTKINISEVNLYSFSSFVPSFKFRKSISAQLYIGVRDSYANAFSHEPLFESSFSLGKTKSLFKSQVFSAYGLAGLSLKGNSEFLFAQATTSFGAISYPTKDLKVLANYSVAKLGSSHVSKFEGSLTWNHFKNLNVGFFSKVERTNQDKVQDTGFFIQRLF